MFSCNENLIRSFTTLILFFVFLLYRKTNLSD